MGDIASEASHNAAVKIGRKPVSFSSSGSVSVSEDKLKKFMDAIKSNPRVVLSGKCIPRTVVIAARELVSAGRKVLAAKRHPDTGGSEEEMRVLNAATQWLTLLISQNEEK
jgi:hypothetical protein